ncbi:TQXA domain-containing protein [Mycetocola sp. BIGb0189]|uniref:Cys-Gln thioester bond-forming surface protein n=1 Tax=Mycetocola sp. BIGb0189 TaxID=2940604 RepID=UPI002169E32C|nr:Cys-Gln thioester bond-forming surface protein [Mycetocola sp. BIGb0189]MCS4276029.1 TQXA domain-containing protein [Mycetocola sp. BIGb0189]
MTPHPPRTTRRLASWIGAAALTLGGILAPAAALAAEPTSTSTTVSAGDTVHVGPGQGYGGTRLFPIWYHSAGVGDPDGWAYCVEHNVSARTDVDGRVDSLDNFLGNNAFTNREIKDRVLWVLTHSYPTVDLEQLAHAAGITDLAVNDAIEATQYAIWRYTDLNFDAAWNWETPNSEAVYWYLIHGANAAPSPAPFPSAASASLTAPSTTQTAGSLAGPFTVKTNQESVSVSAPDVRITDAQGTAIDASAVRDGQSIYLDLRDRTSAGSATLTATASAAGPTGNVISVAAEGSSTPTATAHAQSIVLVQARTATVRAQAEVTWSAVAPTEPTPGSTPTSGTSTGPVVTAAPTAPTSTAASTTASGRAGTDNARLASTGESFPLLALGVAGALLALGYAALRLRRSRGEA